MSEVAWATVGPSSRGFGAEPMATDEPDPRTLMQCIMTENPYATEQELRALCMAEIASEDEMLRVVIDEVVAELWRQKAN
jgi:hypothetical protein